MQPKVLSYGDGEFGGKFACVVYKGKVYLFDVDGQARMTLEIAKIVDVVMREWRMISWNWFTWYEYRKNPAQDGLPARNTILEIRLTGNVLSSNVSALEAGDSLPTSKFPEEINRAFESIG